MMKLTRVLRWEFASNVRSKGFLVMTVLIPAIIAVAIFAVTLVADHEDPGPFSEPPPPHIIALFLAMILFIGAFLSGITTFYGVFKEKQSRAIEMMLSSVSAGELMGGKILGLGLSGLIQVCVWAVTAYFAASRFLPISLETLDLIHWVTYPLYFALGYLLIASMYATVAAGVKDIHSVGATGLVGLIPYSPMMFAAAIITHPDALWVRIAGFVPPLTPGVMLLRLAATPMVTDGTEQVPTWEILLSLVVLAGGVLLMMRFAARVYEVGMLMYGKSASLRELWRWGRRGTS
jgi:ABC-2 type transport system permease protein